MSSRPALSFLLAAVLVALPAALAAQPVPEGPETLVVTSYAAQAVTPAVAFDSGGDLAALLVAGPVDFNSCMRFWGPCAGPIAASRLDRFDARDQAWLNLYAGSPAPLGAEPRLARDGSGMVAAWRGDPYCNIRFGFCRETDGSGSAVFARRIGRDGPEGTLLQVNGHSEGDQGSPAVSVSPVGGFAVAWRSTGADLPGILVRRFSAGGEAGAEVQVSAAGASPQLAHGPQGELLVVWWQETEPGGAGGIFGGLFDSAGLALGAVRRIDDSAGAASPALTALPGGGYAVAWWGRAGPDGTDALRVRRLDGAAMPAGPSQAASFPPQDDVGGYDLAADEAGGLLVAWSGSRVTAEGARQGVFATYLDAADALLWRSEPLSAERPEPVGSVRVASDGKRSYAVVWNALRSPSLLPAIPDVDYYAQRLILPGGSCTTGGGALCLHGRFQVEARWRGAARDGSYDALAVPYAAGSGFLAFADPAGWDLGVKIMDNRARSGHFALFAANLCGPRSALRVVDTGTGRLRVDRFAADTLCGQRDRLAFDASSLHTATGTCRRGPASLCLLDGRFRVRVRWTPPAAVRPALAQAVAGSDRSGLFWFFTADSPAVVVQLVDGRAENGKIWVVHGALTPLAYTVTVTDTATGVVKLYPHPAGSACGQADLEAF